MSSNSKGSGKSSNRGGVNNNSNKKSESKSVSSSSGPPKNAWNKSNESIRGHNNNSPASANNSPSSDGGDQQQYPKKHMHDRLNFLLAKSIGSTAIVTVSSGAQYKGVFSSATTESELGVTLKCASKITTALGEGDDDKSSQQEQQKEWHEILIINPKDLADIKFEAPDLTPDKVADSTSSASSANVTSSSGEGSGGGFKTDSDISSSKSGFFERELQPWSPNEGDLPEATLEESVELNGGPAGWDQFAVNEQKFGVQSTYDEHYYTTAINKDLPNYQEIEKKAEKIAAEINSSSYGGNAHMAEERGLQVEDSSLDEEDKYSGVDRGTKKVPPPVTNNPNKYTPPAFRNAAAGAKGAKGGAQGMPYDPAIISSSIATPDSGKEKDNQPTDDNNVEENGTEHSSKSGGLSKGGIEKELAGNFRQFVSGEVERLHQKKQYLQKREKSERLNDFKKFSEDYKITAPVPPDLIPILAKGKDKQDKIIQKTNSSATNSPETAHSSPVQTKTESSSPATASKPTPAKQPQASPPKKFNVNVPEFRPNPSAHSFTPGSVPPPAAAPPPPPPPVPAAPPIPENTPTSPKQHQQTSKSPISSHASPSQQNPNRQQHPPSSSNNTSRTPTPSMFFGQNKKGPNAKAREDKFNLFKRQKKAYDEALEAVEKSKANNEEPTSTAPHHMIERAWVQGPTWTPGSSDKSYTYIFQTSDSMNSRPYMMSPRGNFPAMPAAAGNMVPMMQPGMEDPNLRVAGGMMSPSPMPGQMFPGFVPAAAMGYPQYAPQYYGRPGGETPQPFMPSPQMMNQAFPSMGYAGAPQQAYGATSPSGMNPAMAPPMYYQGGPPPQQQQYRHNNNRHNNTNGGQE